MTHNKQTKGAVRRWQQGKTDVVITVLRSIAALEGIELPTVRDAGMLRHVLTNSMSASGRVDRRGYITVINAALTRAVGEYLRDNPKPKQGRS